MSAEKNRVCGGGAESDRCTVLECVQPQAP